MLKIAENKYTNNKNTEIKHSSVLTKKQREEIEEKIVEELYRIFTHKA